jgi:hypothetical protein
MSSLLVHFSCAFLPPLLLLLLLLLGLDLLLLAGAGAAAAAGAGVLAAGGFAPPAMSSMAGFTSGVGERPSSSLREAPNSFCRPAMRAVNRLGTAPLVRSADAVLAVGCLPLLLLLLLLLLSSPRMSSSQTQLCALSLRQELRVLYPSQACLRSWVIIRNLVTGRQDKHSAKPGAKELGLLLSVHVVRYRACAVLFMFLSLVHSSKYCGHISPVAAAGMVCASAPGAEGGCNWCLHGASKCCYKRCLLQGSAVVCVDCVEPYQRYGDSGWPRTAYIMSTASAASQELLSLFHSHWFALIAEADAAVLSKRLLCAAVGCASACRRAEATPAAKDAKSSGGEGRLPSEHW